MNGNGSLGVSKKATGSAAGNSEAKERKLAAKAEASKSKKVTLPRLKFMERE